MRRLINSKGKVIGVSTNDGVSSAVRRGKRPAKMVTTNDLGPDRKLRRKSDEKTGK